MKTLSGDDQQLFFRGFLKIFTVNLKLIFLYCALTIKLASMPHGIQTEMQEPLMHLVYHGES